MDSGKKGSQLARRRKHSTLTAGRYYPTPDSALAQYWGVFVNDRPYLLFLDDGSLADIKAKRLAASSNFRTLLEATATACEQIEARPLSGEAVDWAGDHTVISAIRSGDVDTGTSRRGALRAIVLAGSHDAVAETLCIDVALATLLDADFPQVDNFDELPGLSDQDLRTSLGQLEARKHPRGGH